MPPVKAMATVVTFAALVGAVGIASFWFTKDDEPAPVTTTSTTATSVPSPSEDDLAAALTDALAQGLAVPLTPSQAACVADAFLAVVGTETAIGLAQEAKPLGAVTVAQRATIVRGIVRCVPPAIAAALLGNDAPTVTLAPGLPDESSST